MNLRLKFINIILYKTYVSVNFIYSIFETCIVILITDLMMIKLDIPIMDILSEWNYLKSNLI